MKTLAAFSLAVGLIASSAMSLHAQEPDRGPSAYKSGETVNGEITRIDQATKTIEIKASGGTLEYLAKDSSEIAKFHVGDAVSGKISKDTPTKLVNLKASSNKPKMGGGGYSDSTGGMGGRIGGSGTRDSARTGGMSPRD